MNYQVVLRNEGKNCVSPLPLPLPFSFYRPIEIHNLVLVSVVRRIYHMSPFDIILC